jgi:hypothetical protein
MTMANLSIRASRFPPLEEDLPGRSRAKHLRISAWHTWDCHRQRSRSSVRARWQNT